jgi:hypothetical protein
MGGSCGESKAGGAVRFDRRGLEHFQVKWTRFTVENAAQGEVHFQVKWTRFTVENAA